MRRCAGAQAGAVSPGVAIFDQQMMQTVTLYKGNTGWNPKYYDFKLVAISNEYGKKTIASASINLSQLANLDPDVRRIHPMQLAPIAAADARQNSNPSRRCRVFAHTAAGSPPG
jgi:hypothetical protein